MATTWTIWHDGLSEERDSRVFTDVDDAFYFMMEAHRAGINPVMRVDRA